MNHRYRKRQALLFLFTGFLLIAGLVVSCSAAVTPTEDEIKEMATKVESLSMGYEDGTSVQLARNTSQYEDVLRESLRRILAIDAPYPGVVAFRDGNNDDWLRSHKYVQIKFDGSTIITTKIRIPDDERPQTSTNEKGFRILPDPREVLMPLSGSSRGEIWVGGVKLYGPYSSTRPFSHLERIVDSLRE